MGTLAATIKARREELGLTQEYVADKIGVDRSYIAHVETGRIKMPASEVLTALANVLGLDVDDLATAAYATTRPGRVIRERSPEEILRELQAALVRDATRIADSDRRAMINRVLPIHVATQRASGGPGNYITDHEYVPTLMTEELAAKYEYLEGVVVSGDCMAPAISSGDIVIYDTSAQWQIGDVVVAMHQGEAVVKRISKSHERLELVACQGQPPIAVDETTKIAGVVVGVQKKP